MEIIKSNKIDPRGKSRYVYFQVEPVTLKIIRAFECLQAIDKYFKSKGLSTAISRMITGNFASGYHAKGFLWARLHLSDIVFKSNKEINELVNIELEYIKFMNAVTKVNFKLLDKTARENVYKLLKPYIK